MFVVSKSLDDNMDVNKGWKSMRENIRTSIEDNEA